MITATSRFHYRAHADEWRIHADTTTVHCDREGCAAKVTPTGLEYNGAHVECVYGCKGWYLGVVDLCPDHAPKSLDEPCIVAKDGEHDTYTDTDGDQVCRLCRLYRSPEEPTP